MSFKKNIFLSFWLVGDSPYRVTWPNGPTRKKKNDQSSPAARMQIFRSESKNAKDSLFGQEGHLFAREEHLFAKQEHLFAKEDANFQKRGDYMRICRSLIKRYNTVHWSFNRSTVLNPFDLPDELVHIEYFFSIHIKAVGLNLKTARAHSLGLHATVCKPHATQIQPHFST